MIAILILMLVMPAVAMISYHLLFDYYVIRPMRKQILELREDSEMAHIGLETLNASQWRLAKRVEGRAKGAIEILQ